MGHRPRIVIALAVSAMLIVFLGYTVFAGASEDLVSVSQLQHDADGSAHHNVQLTGLVVAARRTAGVTRFTLRDDASDATVRVYYNNPVPDAFAVGRNVLISGRLDQSGSLFLGTPGTLLTKCPSKYSAHATTEGGIAKDN